MSADDAGRLSPDGKRDGKCDEQYQQKSHISGYRNTAHAKMKLVFPAIKEEITRRRVLWITPFALAGLVAIWPRRGARAAASDQLGEVTIVQFSDAGKKLETALVRKVVHTDGEWRKLLSSEQYYVTRHAATDTAFTGTYYEIHDAGLFRCICCATALFSSDTKFDSGTGWPSFWAPIAEENVRRHSDVSFGMERVEVLCKRCDAHLGHVFDDGPAPTNLRYCINESSLRFVRRGA
jgi:peptide-methionine (R)-S-oxide reductase